MRGLAPAVAVVALAGCGFPGDPRTPEESMACLVSAGVQVTSQPAQEAIPSPDTPDHRLLIPGGVVYFFDFEQEAEEGFPDVEDEAVRVHGTVEREGRVIFLWRAGVSDGQKSQVRDCVLG